MALIEKFFYQARRFGANKYTKGLPRGILLSSTLAELYLKTVDDEISNIPGVYVYTRYVDDILIISSHSSKPLFQEVANIISKQNLKVNLAKLKILDAGCRCAFDCAHSVGHCPCHDKCKCQINNYNLEHIDYLGYRLIFQTGKDLNASNVCHALISPRKMQKIKSRVELSIINYKKNRNATLLKERIVFLTSNITIDRSLRKSRLLSGIAFTYSAYSPPNFPHPYERLTLESLDRFLKTRIRVLAKAGTLSYTQKHHLLKRSFVSAYKHRLRSTFTLDEIKSIRSCWTNA